MQGLESEQVFQLMANLNIDSFGKLSKMHAQFSPYFLNPETMRRTLDLHDSLSVPYSDRILLLYTIMVLMGELPKEKQQEFFPFTLFERIKNREVHLVESH